MAYAIRAEGVSKRYRLSQSPGSDRTLRDALVRLSQAPARWLSRQGGGRAASEFYALRDVSFEVRPGEVVGLIGANGAGKSTLLKILSKITRPTAGVVRIRGRVGSLLEAGTGFHPELTGRENVYLSGTFLGMSRGEIARKMETIVGFSGVEAFIDTPVKRYSSGMQARLGFSVAAHLETETLIVDEALSVGDAEFQKKCAEKMQRLSRGGRTVLFVSHSLPSLRVLCKRGLFFDHGRLLVDDTMEAAAAAYLKRLDQDAPAEPSKRPAPAPGPEAAGRVNGEPADWPLQRGGLGEVRLTEVQITAGDEQPTAVLTSGGPARFGFRLSGVRPGLGCHFTFYNQGEQAVAHVDSGRPSPADAVAPGGDAWFLCRFEEFLLLPGSYSMNVAVDAGGKMQDHVRRAACFEVRPGAVRGRPVYNAVCGNVALPHQWTVPAPAE